MQHTQCDTEGCALHRGLSSAGSVAKCRGILLLDGIGPHQHPHPLRPASAKVRTNTKILTFMIAAGRTVPVALPLNDRKHITIICEQNKESFNVNACALWGPRAWTPSIVTVQGITSCLFWASYDHIRQEGSTPGSYWGSYVDPEIGHLKWGLLCSYSVTRQKQSDLDRLLPQYFHFIVHWPTYHSTLHNLSCR
jgi:hypothetical protein